LLILPTGGKSNNQRIKKRPVCTGR